MHIGLTVVLAATAIVAISVVAGLMNGILHRADGANLPAAVRAGGRAGFAVLVAVAGVAGA
ncbi:MULTISPECIES: hypothetical protein [Frankia]|uniref:hypothetical protein n=1 Tax=Frankia TaxID=1854 RepID=UPI0002E7CF3F|nr:MULTISPECIES: hypothetical protein [Frankia]